MRSQYFVCALFVSLAFLHNASPASFSISGAVGGVAKLPITITRSLASGSIKGIKTSIKLPAELTEKILQLTTSGFKGVNSINSKVVSESIRVTVAIIEKFLDVFVNLGVFQGKTTFDVLNGFDHLSTKSINVIFAIITKTLTSASNLSKATVNLSHIKSVVKLPIVKQIVAVNAGVVQKIQGAYGAQISEFSRFADAEIDKHGTYFQPIFNRISNTIVIISEFVIEIRSGDPDAKLSEAQIKAIKRILGLLKVRTNGLKTKSGCPCPPGWPPHGGSTVLGGNGSPPGKGSFDGEGGVGPEMTTKPPCRPRPK